MGTFYFEIIKEGTEYEIMDGQQRLTTLIIFMRALINVLKQKGADEDLIDDLMSSFIKRKGFIKLKPVDNDKVCFNAIVVDRLKSYLMYQMYVYSPTDETLINVEGISNNFKDI